MTSIRPPKLPSALAATSAGWDTTVAALQGAASFPPVEPPATPQRLECAAVQCEPLRRGPLISGGGAHVRRDPDGRIRWYRSGNLEGRAYRLHPLQRQISKLEAAYLPEKRNPPRKDECGRLGGQRSGAARRERGLYEKIRLRSLQLLERGVPPRHLAKKLAQELECTVKYVRDVLRRQRIESAH